MKRKGPRPGHAPSPRHVQGEEKGGVNRNWSEGITAEDLPEGDLRLIAESCGMEVALSLAERMGGMQLYIRNIDAVLNRKKEDFVIRNAGNFSRRELARKTGCTERWVYRVLSRGRR